MYTVKGRQAEVIQLAKKEHVDFTMILRGILTSFFYQKKRFFQMRHTTRGGNPKYPKFEKN